MYTVFDSWICCPVFLLTNGRNEKNERGQNFTFLIREWCTKIFSSHTVSFFFVDFNFFKQIVAFSLYDIKECEEKFNDIR